MLPRHLAPLACLSLLVMAPALAEANPPSIDAPDQDPLIANGSPVAQCAWPTAVAVTSGGGLCTGTLIHPELVVYAAHCGAGNKTIRFGENAFSGGRTAATAFCRTNMRLVAARGSAGEWGYGGQARCLNASGATHTVDRGSDKSVSPARSRMSVRVRSGVTTPRGAR